MLEEGSYNVHSFYSLLKSAHLRTIIVRCRTKAGLDKSAKPLCSLFKNKYEMVSLFLLYISSASSQIPHIKCTIKLSYLFPYLEKISIMLSAPTSSSSSQKVYRKRPHNKVKTGCTRCKQRKIKCDELKPSCSQCVRTSWQCEYSVSTSDTRDSSPPELVSAMPSPEDDPLLVPHIDVINIADLELMHAWTAYACYGFGDLPNDTTVWSIDVPQLACQHPFLMHCLLAVSALYMALRRPDQRTKHVSQAESHQSLGLPPYRHVVEDIEGRLTEDMSHAIVAFASLTSVYAFASHPDEYLPSTTTFTSSIIPQWLHLLRGARKITSFKPEWILRGPMAYQLRCPDDIDVDVSYNLEDDQLAALAPLISKTEDPEDGLVLSQTLELLRRSFALALQPTPYIGLKLSLFWWVEHVPNRYLELLGEWNQPALILLAYFCVMVERGARTCWYLEGVAERTLLSIEQSLDWDMREWLAWPSQQVRDSMMWEMR